MKIDFFEEPELEFGVGLHVDIRYGIMNCGPVDFNSSLAPKEIHLGLVGNNETVEGVHNWLEKCTGEIPAKKSQKPNLFPRFPGFAPDVGFHSSVVMDTTLNRSVRQADLDALLKIGSVNQVIKETSNLFYDELKYIAEKAKVRVLVCALPQALLEHIAVLSNPVRNRTRVENEKKAENQSETDESDPALETQPAAVDEESDDDADENLLNLHHMLKARAMDLNIPVQIIVPSTYDETKKRRDHFLTDTKGVTQDEATRAWNLHTALYYKAGGIPWRMVRSLSDFTTCYVGVSFYKTLDNSTLQTSIAQVFNERGEGMVVRGGQARVSKDDRQVHLSSEAAQKLLEDALAQYHKEHKTSPARVVVHKSSKHSQEEIDGFTAAARNYHIEMVDLVSLDKSFTRLFRKGFYPPLRGTFISLDARSHLLYTRGSVHFFATYPGQYVPRSLLFRCEQTEQTPAFLGREILVLTKMNWNNTQFDGIFPITMRASRQVGGILKYIGNNDPIAPYYRFYM